MASGKDYADEINRLRDEIERLRIQAGEVCQKLQTGAEVFRAERVTLKLTPWQQSVDTLWDMWRGATPSPGPGLSSHVDEVQK